MPGLTNRSALKAHPGPALPPWSFLPSRAVEYWLGVSAQTLVNWRNRGTGPICYRDASRRVWYRIADVRAWLDDGYDPTVYVLNYLKDNEAKWSLRHSSFDNHQAYMSAPQNLRRRLIGLASRQIDMLTSAELFELGKLLTSVGVFGGILKPSNGLVLCSDPRAVHAHLFTHPAPSALA